MVRPLQGLDRMTDTDFFGEWYGWRLRGRYLVSPDGQRLTRERLLGLLVRDSLELRVAGLTTRQAAEANKRRSQYGPQVKVIVIDLAEYRCRGSLVG
jgi:hypothetical protein